MKTTNTRRTRQLALLALLLVLAIVALLNLPNGLWEPGYQGKSLAHWVHDLDSTSSQEKTNAVFAIRHIGTNALPFLVRRLNVRDSGLKLWCEKILARQRWVRIHFRDNYQLHHEAMRALAILGPEARSAIPDVARHVNDYPDTLMATYTLWQIGTNSTPVLVEALTNANNSWVRVNVIESLGHLHDPSSVSQLLALLKYPDHPTYSSVCGVLGLFADQADKIVPVLIDRLDEHDPVYQKEIASTLGQMGPAARDAWPKLLRLVNGTNDLVREAAARAMIKIDFGGTLAVLTNNLAAADATNRWISAWALKFYGSEGKPAVVALIKCLQDPDGETRSNAAVALDAIWPGTSTALPALLDRMSNPDPAVRLRAAIALGKFGELAKPVVPAILQLLEENRSNLRNSNRLYMALSRIDPDTAAKWAKAQELLEKR